MAREMVQDIDAIAERLMATGLLKFRLMSAVQPVGRVDHADRRAYGLE